MGHCGSVKQNGCDKLMWILGISVGLYQVGVKDRFVWMKDRSIDRCHTLSAFLNHKNVLGDWML